jgi:hypothetical protein
MSKKRDASQERRKAWAAAAWWMPLAVPLLRRFLGHFGPQLDVEDAEEIAELPVDLLDCSRPLRILFKHGIITCGQDRWRPPYTWVTPVGMIRDFHDRISNTCSLKALCGLFRPHCLKINSS